MSQNENELIEFTKKLIGEENIIINDTSVVDSEHELTIYVPKLNAAISYCDLSNEARNRYASNKYNITKLNVCKEKGIKLLQIFEDEYYYRKQVVFNKIAHILHCQQNLPTIMGRKCKIQEIDMPTAKKFLELYHVQGYATSTIYLGAFYNDELIGVMSFKKDANQKHSADEKNWDLTRFASNYNYICQGVGGKLFKYFIKHYEFNEIKSFADRRWTVDEENNVYKQLGFEFDFYTICDYRYLRPEEHEHPLREHKFSFRKKILSKKYDVPFEWTESHMCEHLGFPRIYDCGLIRYVYKKNTSE